MPPHNFDLPLVLFYYLLYFTLRFNIPQVPVVPDLEHWKIASLTAKSALEKQP